MILQGIGIGLSILSGMGKVSAAESITKAKKESLKMKADYNKGQVDESLENNYAILMANYANQRGQLAIDRAKADNSVRIVATQNVGDIDIQGSSVFANANAQADNEYLQNLNALDDWKFNQKVNLNNAAINKKLQIDLGVIDTMGQLDLQQQQAESQGYMDIINGGLKAFDLYSNYKSDKSSQDTFNAGVNQYVNNVLSGSEYYNNLTGRQNTSLHLGGGGNYDNGNGYLQSIRNFGLNK